MNVFSNFHSVIFSFVNGLVLNDAGCATGDFREFSKMPSATTFPPSSTYIVGPTVGVWITPFQLLVLKSFQCDRILTDTMITLAGSWKWAHVERSGWGIDTEWGIGTEQFHCAGVRFICNEHVCLIMLFYVCVVVCIVCVNCVVLGLIVLFYVFLC